MPEVPELNLVGLTLQKHFKGKKVEEIKILYPKRVKASQEEFEKALVGATLQSVDRNGKELHLQFDNGQVLGIHMMLTGRMQMLPCEVPLKYPIFQLLFENDCGIEVADGMGQAKPILNPEVPEIPDIMANAFDLDYFRTITSKSGKKIKEVLLDQHLMRGIGNAYADEILWHSRISPFSHANVIPVERIADLFNSIKEVTREATAALESTKPNEASFQMENNDHRFIHNPAKKVSPDGFPILQEKLGPSKTYYTESQILYQTAKKKK